MFHHGNLKHYLLKVLNHLQSDNSLTMALNCYGTKTRVKFTRSFLKQSEILYTHGKIVNIYIVYELGASSSNDNDPTLKK